jgi:hypothetical protein
MGGAFERIKRRTLRKTQSTARDVVLVKSVWEQGTSPQKVVRYLARIHDAYITAPSHRHRFWLRFDASLAGLYLDPDTRAHLEQRIAREVTRPTQEELETLWQPQAVLQHFGLGGGALVERLPS